MSQQNAKNAIPIIDVTAFGDPHSSREDRISVANEIGQACRQVGFFYVKNHGIPRTHRSLVFERMKAFFELPLETKMDYFIGDSDHYSGYIPLGWEETAGLKDWHEALLFRPAVAAGQSSPLPPSRLRDSIDWPTEPGEFKAALEAHWDHMTLLGERIARGIALSLKVDASFLESFTKNAYCTMRVLHYPEYEANRPGIGEGFGPHVDYGFLTILDQEGVSGLEILNAEGDWTRIFSVPDCYIVNIGRVLQIWSNDHYPATLHRVRGVQGDRYSLPFFYNPGLDAIIEPLPECCSADRPPRYQPYHYGDFTLERMRKAFTSNVS